MDYRYTYDKDGLLLTRKASGRTLLAYTYDELGRKASQTDITGRKVNYRFDKSNRLADICNEIDQSIVKVTRDADGAIQKITHANGMWQDITYDADKSLRCRRPASRNGRKRQARSVHLQRKQGSNRRKRGKKIKIGELIK